MMIGPRGVQSVACRVGRGNLCNCDSGRAAKRIPCSPFLPENYIFI